jgi:hypothetical protein
MSPEMVRRASEDLKREVMLSEVFGNDPDLVAAAEEACYYLDLFAPFVPALMPIIGLVLRARVEQLEKDMKGRGE